MAWDGINALNAASLAIMGIHANRETFRDEDRVRVHPILTKGGDLVNTVPADVQMESYVRAASIPAMQSANAKVNRSIQGAAFMVGAEVDIRDIPGYLPMKQNAAMSQLFEKNAKEIAPELSVEHGHVFCGSTDMGDLSYLIPVIQPTITGFAGAAHSKDFRITDKIQAYILPAKLMAATVIDLLAFCLSRFTGLSIYAIYFMVMSVDLIKCVIGFVLVKKGVWLQNIVDGHFLCRTFMFNRVDAVLLEVLAIGGGMCDCRLQPHPHGRFLCSCRLHHRCMSWR